MWPFKHNVLIRCESQALAAFEHALEEIRQLIRELAAGSNVGDIRIRAVYFAMSNRMQSNCDSVASDLLATIGSICAHADHLAGDLLPSALRPMYYLGIEDWNRVQAYIRNVARDGKTNLDTQSPEGRRFLQRIVEDQNLIVD
jgi:hypothetical protein